jgi:hypothetical protein
MAILTVPTSCSSISVSRVRTASIQSAKRLATSVSLAFETKPVAGQPLSARGYHVSLLADSRVFAFGGFNGQDVYEDVHILDLAGSGYLAQVCMLL